MVREARNLSSTYPTIFPNRIVAAPCQSLLDRLKLCCMPGLPTQIRYRFLNRPVLSVVDERVFEGLNGYVNGMALPVTNHLGWALQDQAAL